MYLIKLSQSQKDEVVFEALHKGWQSLIHVFIQQPQHLLCVGHYSK